MSSDTPPSIPPRTTSGQSKKPGAGSSAGGRTATDTTARGSATSATQKSGSKSTGSGPATSTGAKPGTAKPADAPATTSTPRTGSASGTTATGAAATSAPKPASSTTASAKPAASSTTTSSLSAGTGPRRVRLAISRVDPWSVMKLSFLISVAIGIMIVVATAVVWLTLDSLEVFATINGLVTEILADSEIDLMQYVEFDRVISVAVLVAVVDVLLITALATIGAFLYNITAALVGGVHVTMTDE